MSDQGKTTSHTPGPWGVEQTTVSNWIGRMRADGSKVEYIVAHTDRDSLRDDVLVQNDANARLIAAAPELLAACKAALTIAAVSANREEVFDQIAAAVRKAVCGK